MCTEDQATMVKVNEKFRGDNRNSRNYLSSLSSEDTCGVNQYSMSASPLILSVVESNRDKKERSGRGRGTLGKPR